MKIMYVDDDVEDIEVFSEALRRVDQSVEVSAVTDAREALQLLQRCMPHCIIIDLNMPVMNGKEFLLELRRNPRFRGIPVVVCTTSSSTTDREDCLRLGASMFFTKALTFAGMVEIAGKALKSAS